MDAVKVIACIEDPVVIEKILTHLNEKGQCGKNRQPQKMPDRNPNKGRTWAGQRCCRSWPNNRRAW